jgi:hypothetical protein
LLPLRNINQRAFRKNSYINIKCLSLTFKYFFLLDRTVCNVSRRIEVILPCMSIVLSNILSELIVYECSSGSYLIRRKEHLNLKLVRKINNLYHTLRFWSEYMSRGYPAHYTVTKLSGMGKTNCSLLCKKIYFYRILSE